MFRWFSKRRTNACAKPKNADGAHHFCLLLSLFPEPHLRTTQRPIYRCAARRRIGIIAHGHLRHRRLDNVPARLRVYRAENGSAYALSVPRPFGIADKDLVTRNDYSYKVRAFMTEGTVVYSDMSEEISVSPRCALLSGSSVWRFSDEVRKRLACSRRSQSSPQHGHRCHASHRL